MTTPMNLVPEPYTESDLIQRIRRIPEHHTLGGMVVPVPSDDLAELLALAAVKLTPEQRGSKAFERWMADDSPPEMKPEMKRSDYGAGGGGG